MRERQEFSQRTLSDYELLTIWSGDLDFLRSKLEEASKLGELVDVIRSANLHAVEAGRRLHFLLPTSTVFGRFQDFQQSWYDLKYQCLIKALEWRQQGNPYIIVGYKDVQRKRDNLTGTTKKIVFSFQFDSGCYRTETAHQNLANLLSTDVLEALIGKLDPIPSWHHGPRHSEGFRQAQKGQR